METMGTQHLTVNAFSDALQDAHHGDRIIYATGDLAYSAAYSAELRELRDFVQQKANEKTGMLFRRKVPNSKFPYRAQSVAWGACFEYLFVKIER